MKGRPFIGALYVDHADAVRAKLRRLGVARNDVDDLCHNVFVVAHCRYRQVPPDANGARLWLFDVARKLAANDRRRAHRTHEIFDGNALATARATPEDPEADIALRDFVRMTARVLSPADRAVLIFYHIEGKVLPEIALSRNVSKSRIAFCLKKAEARYRSIVVRALARDERSVGGAFL